MLDHDHIKRKLRLEFDLVECLEVGRIRDRNRQAIAALAQRQDARSAYQLLVDDVLGQLIDVDGRQIEQRVAKGVGGELGDRPDGGGLGQGSRGCPCSG
jgi:hypothetical protein